jgi:acyl-[acyl-carrier-protein]-phospholipid O-acyltransferase / long-chain-fatty-acid--[acyl-carrier-protein] ligase
LGCQHLLKGKVSLKYAPWSLLVIALLGVDLYFVALSLDAPHGALINLSHYFVQFSDWRIMFDLAGLAIAGGTFIVPLYTTLQVESDPENRARTIASNNVLNAFFVAMAAMGAVALYTLGMLVEEVLLVFSLLSLPMIGLLWKWRER